MTRGGQLTRISADKTPGFEPSWTPAPPVCAHAGLTHMHSHVTLHDASPV